MLESYENYYIDIYETEKEKPSYTIDSIRRITNAMNISSELYFIIGADSLMYLDKWYDAKELMGITKFVVVQRYGFSMDDCLMKIYELEREYSAKIIYIECDYIDISSTGIRDTIREISLYNKLDQKVKDYIIENGLYK